MAAYTDRSHLVNMCVPQAISNEDVNPEERANCARALRILEIDQIFGDVDENQADDSVEISRSVKIDIMVIHQKLK